MGRKPKQVPADDQIESQAEEAPQPKQVIEAPVESSVTEIPLSKAKKVKGTKITSIPPAIEVIELSKISKVPELSNGTKVPELSKVIEGTEVTEGVKMIKKYGTREDVFNGLAERTRAGLTKDDFFQKGKRIISKKASERAKNSVLVLKHQSNPLETLKSYSKKARDEHVNEVKNSRSQVRDTNSAVKRIAVIPKK